MDKREVMRLLKMSAHTEEYVRGAQVVAARRLEAAGLATLRNNSDNDRELEPWSAILTDAGIAYGRATCVACEGADGWKLDPIDDAQCTPCREAEERTVSDAHGASPS